MGSYIVLLYYCIIQPRSQGLFPILSPPRTQDREETLGTRLCIIVLDLVYLIGVKKYATPTKTGS